MIYMPLFYRAKYSFKLLVRSNADIGADVLDLAETMVASDGLNYEPVSNIHVHFSVAYYCYCISERGNNLFTFLGQL